jgi:hypothetical protein
MLSGEEAKRTDVVVSIVWIPMLPGDSARAAQAATALVSDARARHYFDPERRAGRAIAGRMGGEGKIAWDMYLFFAPDATWEAEPPLPMEWAHQLGDTAWADPARCHRGEGLVAALAGLLRQCSPPLPPAETVK